MPQPRRHSGGYSLVEEVNGRHRCTHISCANESKTWRGRRDAAQHALQHLTTTENTVWCYACDFNLHVEEDDKIERMKEHFKVHQWDARRPMKCEGCRVAWYYSNHLLSTHHKNKRICPARPEHEGKLPGRTWNGLTHQFDYADNVIPNCVRFPPVETPPPTESEPSPTHYATLPSLDDLGFRAMVDSHSRHFPPGDQHSLAITPIRLSRRKTVVYGQSFTG